MRIKSKIKTMIHMLRDNKTKTGVIQIFLTLILLSPISVSGQECTPNSRPMLPDDRFQLLRGGLVQDKVTQLIWPRCAVGQVFDKGQCIEPNRNQIRTWFDWASALRELAKWQQQEPDMHWRLPSVDELSTIIEKTCIDPATNENIFPHMPSWTFWTSTSFSINDTYHWVVDFSNGDIYTDLKETAIHSLRFVSGAPLRLDKEDVETVEDDLQLWDDGIHDTSNSSLKALQPFTVAAQFLPKDETGMPDYVKALRNGDIKPRTSISGSDDLPTYDGDMLYIHTGEMPWVKFPHKAHTEWLACENCHDNIFKKNSKPSRFSMQLLYQGQACGTCHDKVAFSLSNCERCHSVMHDKVPENWKTFINREQTK